MFNQNKIPCSSWWKQKNILKQHLAQAQFLKSRDTSSCLVIGCPVDVEELDNVGMWSELLQKYDLSKGSLRVRSITKGVENFLHGNHRPGFYDQTQEFSIFHKD